MATYVFLLTTLFVVASSVCPQDRPNLVRFSQQSSWIAPNAVVTIPSGTSALVDVSVNIKSITVSGDLIFANSALNLSAEFILVNSNGGLYMGSTESGCSITSKITITLKGDRQPITVSQMGMDPFDSTLLGSKGIGIATGGTIQIVGSVPSITWTRLASTVLNGSNTITLQETTGWSVGDQIVIATTDFPEATKSAMPSSISYIRGRGQPDQNEVRTIAAINGKTITLNSPLNYTHWGQDYEIAEVGLLTRKIVIQGDNTSVPSLYGGHIMVRRAASATIVGAELVNMGQRGNLGRYPIHFHLTKDSFNMGYVVRANTVRDSFQRCYVCHYSNGVLWKDNVAYNNTGHCYFLEDGSELGNTYDHNLGIKTMPVASEDPLQVLPTDTQPAMFWITNPNNTYTRNAAVEATFGYWFSMPQSPTGISAGDYPLNDLWVRPRNAPLGGFDKNIAHSNRRNGIHADDMVQPDLTTSLASYSPQVAPYNKSVSLEVNFTNCIAYKNRGYGVWARGGPFRWINYVAADNMRGFNCPPSPSVLENSLIIGETDNVGMPLAAELNRTRPSSYSNNQLIKGWETYDNSGAQYILSTTFVNFTSNSIRKAAAISCLECGPYLMQSRDRARNITLINSNAAYLTPCTNGDNPYAWSFFDVDGTLTGNPSWIISNNSLMADSSCIWKEEWNAYNCPAFKEGSYLQLSFNVPGAENDGPEFKGQWTTAGSLRNNSRIFVYPLGGVGSVGYAGTGKPSGGTANWIVQANVKPRNAYAVRFQPGTAVPGTFSVNVAACTPGDWLYLAIPYPSPMLPFNVTRGNVPLTQVSTLAELINRNQFYYDTASSNLYIRHDCSSTSRSLRWGFTDTPGYETGVTISSKCILTTCPVPTAAQVAIPAAFSMYPKEDEFAAQLQSCQSTTRSTSGGGVAYFFYNPATGYLTYKVTHNLASIVTGITIGNGAAGQSGTPLITLDYIDSPASWWAPITRTNWIDLLKGNLYVSVQTTQNPEHIRGQIGCMGTCSLPPAVASVDACSPSSYGSLVYPIFIDGNWTIRGVSPSMYSGGTDTVKTIGIYTPSTYKCGNSSIQVTIQNGAFGFWLSNAVNLSLGYTHFQFWATLGAGNQTEALKIRFIDSNNNVSAVTIAPQWIDDQVVSENGWTRVRIPLASVLYSFTTNIKSFYIYRATSSATAPYKILYLDEMRFTGPIAEQTGSTISASSVWKLTSICTSPNTPAPISGTVIPPSASSSSDSLTGTSNLNSGSVVYVNVLLLIALIAVMF